MKKIIFLFFILFSGSLLFSQVPNPPVLIYPPNNATGLNPNNILFKWTKVTGALSYRIKIFQGPITILDTSGLPDTLYQIKPNVLTATTQYYWAINVTTSGGTSNWSNTHNFTTGIAPPPAPVLLIPANGSTCISIHPFFDYNSVPGTIANILQISKHSNFDTLIVNDTTPFSPITLEYNTLYCWRVCSINSQGGGPWSSIYHFTTLLEPLNPPVLISPVNNAVDISLTPTFDWADVMYSTSYRLQVSLSPLFNSYVLNLLVQSSQYIVPTGVLQGNTYYYWRVGTENGCALFGLNSDVWNFKTTNSSGVNLISSEIPSEYKLYQNYPNPFNPATTIKYQVAGKKSEFSSQKSEVKLVVYDLLGREIATLVNEKQSPGYYEVTFDGKNLPSGIYYYKIITEGFTDVKRMVLLK